MNTNLKYILVVIFSVFLGSQITEGVLLVPYWQSLSSSDFYNYYQAFGPAIGTFYTILTIAAALVPVFLAIYFFRTKSEGLTYSLISCLFAVLFVACFYVYFKDANELFYNAAFDETNLKNELITWSRWHWGRVIIECLSLVYLILAIGKNR